MCKKYLLIFYLFLFWYLHSSSKVNFVFAYDLWNEPCNFDSECFQTGPNYCCEGDSAYCNDYISGVCRDGSGIANSPPTGSCYPGVSATGIAHTDNCPCGCTDAGGPARCIYPCTTITGTPPVGSTPTPPDWCPNTSCNPPWIKHGDSCGCCCLTQEQIDDGGTCCDNPSKDCVVDYGGQGFSCQDEGLNAGESCTLAMSYSGQWRVLSEDVTTNIDWTREARASCSSGKDCLRQCGAQDIPKNMCVININPRNVTALNDLDRFDVQVHNVPVAWELGEGACLPTDSCDQGPRNYITMSINYNPAAGSTGGPWTGMNNSGSWERVMGCLRQCDAGYPFSDWSKTRSECIASGDDDDLGAKSLASWAFPKHCWAGDAEIAWRYSGGKICCDGWREDTADLDHHPMCTTPGTVAGTVSTPNVYSDGLEASVEVVRFRFTISGRQNIVAAPAAMPQGEAIRLHDVTPGYGNPIVWAEPGSGIGVADNGDILTHQCTYTVSANRLVWEFECKIPWHQDRIGETRTIKFVTKYNEEGEINYRISDCTSVCSAPYCGQDDGCGFACADTDAGQPPKVTTLAPGSLYQSNPQEINDQTSSISFQWQANADSLTDGYYFAIFKDNGDLALGQSIGDKNTDGDKNTERRIIEKSLLTPALVYHWQIRAQNTTCAPTTESDWSDPRYFFLTQPTQVESWWQIVGGNGFAAQQITSKIPPLLGSFFIEEDFISTAASAGLPMCSTGGSINVEGFYTNRSPALVVEDHPDYICNKYNLNTFKKQLDITGSTLPASTGTQSISAINQIITNPKTITLPDGSLLYYHQGELTLDPNTKWQVTDKIIVIVEGDVIIDSTVIPQGELISIDQDSFLGIIASGDITYSQRVGYNDQETVNTSLPNWRGLMFAFGSLVTESTGDVDTDKKLIVKGNHIGCGGVNLNRTFAPAVNPLTPAEVFIYDPTLATNIPLSLKEVKIQWQESL